MIKTITRHISIIFLILISFLHSCNERPKEKKAKEKIIDLPISIHTNIDSFVAVHSDDELFLGFYYGMNEEVYKLLKQELIKNGKLSFDSVYTLYYSSDGKWLGLHVNSLFENHKLQEMDLYNSDVDTIISEEIFNLYYQKFGEPGYIDKWIKDMEIGRLFIKNNTIIDFDGGCYHPIKGLPNMGPGLGINYMSKYGLRKEFEKEQQEEKLKQQKENIKQKENEKKADSTLKDI